MKQLNPKWAETERQMFISLAEQSTEFIGICDMNFMPFFVNDAGLETVGLDSLEQALKTPVTEFFFPEDQQFIHKTFFPRVLRDGRSEVEIRFRHFKTGQALWMIYNVFHVMDTTGKPIGFATVSRNITERKQVEEQLYASQIDLNHAQEVGHIGSWRLDVRNNKLTWSAENHHIFGIPPGIPMTYETFLSAIHPDDREYVDRMWQAALQGEPYDIEHRLVVNDKIKWVREKAVLECDATGTVIGGFGTTQDISKYKRYEKALHEADERKNEFLAILAHELRNPLTPIRNAAAILKRSSSPDKATQTELNIIERQSELMARLIDDLMDVSRITHGKLHLQKESVDLAMIFEQTRKAILPHAEQAGLVLTVTPPTELTHLDADPVRLSQILMNLLNNACKYTKKGGAIELTAERVGAHVAIKVSDTGIGIPPEYLSELFEIFSQVPSTFERNQGGLGIGLSLVRALVELHDGSIEVKSDGYGQGSEFIVRLPVSKVTHTSKLLPVQDSNVNKSTARRILVVDDNEDVAKSITLLLQVSGHDVLMIHDGLQAVDVTAKFKPDVVLMDINMPLLDGYRACQDIREQSPCKDIKIYAVTGMGREQDHIKSKECGFDGHLIKPFDPEALLQLVK